MEYRYREDIEMKDSGIEWIGKIPKDWEVSKLKNLVTIVTGNTPSKNDEGNYKEGYIPWIKPDNITDEFKVTESKEKLSYEGAKQARLIPKNSALVCCIGTVGKVGINEIECATNQQINSIVFDKKVWSNKFGIYTLIASRQEHERNSSKVVVSILNKSQQGNIYMPIGNLKEQEKIASFLDEKTSQFDSIISKKEALIKKLEEAKKSLISEVVTGKVKVVKNNDGYELVKRSSGEMKDSGAEWLGEIPKDWEAKRIKYLFEIKKNIAKALGYDVLSVTQSGIKIKDITKNEGQLSMDYSKYQIVDIGDFVMNHMDLLTGFVDCSKFNGVTSPDYRVFKLIDSNNCKQYYNYIFQSCYHNRIFYSLAQGVSGMGRWRLQTDTFKNFIIPMPSFKEQEKIALVLTNKIKDIDKLKNKLVVNIQKLKEAKQSLISETVTGKIEILD